MSSRLRRGDGQQGNTRIDFVDASAGMRGVGCMRQMASSSSVSGVAFSSNRRGFRIRGRSIVPESVVSPAAMGRPIPLRNLFACCADSMRAQSVAKRRLKQPVLSNAGIFSGTCALESIRRDRRKSARWNGAEDQICQSIVSNAERHSCAGLKCAEGCVRIA